MIASTDSMMPMGKAALKDQGAPPPLPPMLPPPPKGNTPMPLPMPPQAPPAAQVPMPPLPGGLPMPPTSAPPAGMPAQPSVPWQVKQQPDGSSVNFIPSPDGNAANDVIIGVNPPPKLPRAFQPPKGQPQQ